MKSITSNRLHFIDFTRGIAMILMAWDHVSMFWMQIHGGGEGLYTIRDPELTPVLFLARFISHWCAPTFVFLSGVSIALSTSSRKRKGYSESEITLHLIKRGLLLLLFETLIVSEIQKHYYHQGSTPQHYFLRDKQGFEIDYVIPQNSTLKAIEVKAGQTVADSFFKNLSYWQKLNLLKPELSYLIYSGDKSEKRQAGQIFPWQKLAEILD